MARKPIETTDESVASDATVKKTTKKAPAKKKSAAPKRKTVAKKTTKRRSAAAAPSDTDAEPGEAQSMDVQSADARTAEAPAPVAESVFTPALGAPAGDFAKKSATAPVLDPDGPSLQPQPARMEVTLPIHERLTAPTADIARGENGLTTADARTDGLPEIVKKKSRRRTRGGAKRKRMHPSPPGASTPTDDAPMPVEPSVEARAALPASADVTRTRLDADTQGDSRPTERPQFDSAPRGPVHGPFGGGAPAQVPPRAPASMPVAPKVDRAPFGFGIIDVPQPTTRPPSPVDRIPTPTVASPTVASPPVAESAGAATRDNPLADPLAETRPPRKRRKRRSSRRSAEARREPPPSTGAIPARSDDRIADVSRDAETNRASWSNTVAETGRLADTDKPVPADRIPDSNRLSETDWADDTDWNDDTEWSGRAEQIVEADPVAEVSQGSPAKESSDTTEESAEATHARLVMKQRPPRRARGGRRRRRGGKKTDLQTTPGQERPAEELGELRETAEDDLPAMVDDPTMSSIVASSVAPTEELTESTLPSKRKRSARRGRKRKTAHPSSSVEIDDDEDDGPDPDFVEDDDDDDESAELTGGREMIINVTAGAECRIAILHENRLEELYIERQSAASHVGNIYKGRVTNVEPSIQAAFVDFGLAKNGFLHISDVQPKYFPDGNKELEPVGKKIARRDRPPIQKCFRRGDSVIVQVVKEGVGTKGPTLTTYLSIPGRFVVMMPGMNKLGVSRKIEDETDRRAMREVLSQLSLPDGMGFILRTAGLGRTKRELQSDFNYLSRLWKTVEARIQSQSAPCELYQESDLVIRTIRDIYSSDFQRIIVDDPETARKATEFLRIAMPRSTGAVIEYTQHEPIFHHYKIEEEIQRIHSRHVPLPSGGSIVIDTTEAMVTIDVNSGKFRDLNDAEETAFRIDVEAAEEIARQLRLRDLGGLVVCDFIDLRLDRHKRAVEKALRDALKKHKERARILRMSKFGLIEMTRQRQRQSLKRSIFVDCPHCSGSGLMKTPESMSLEVIRVVQLLAHRAEVSRITASVSPMVAAPVLNDRRAFLQNLENVSGKIITIIPDPKFAHDQVSYECTDHRGMPLKVDM